MSGLCKTCDNPAAFDDCDKCTNCWEVEKRLDDYLKSDRGRKLVCAALEQQRAALEQQRAELNSEEKDLLVAGERIKAILAYRIRTGASLREAKNRVNYIK